MLTETIFQGKKIEISNDDLIKSEENIEIIGCSGNNLKKVDLKIPLENLVCITGVSGSGKSTLINQTLFPALVIVLINQIYYLNRLKRSKV